MSHTTTPPSRRPALRTAPRRTRTLVPTAALLLAAATGPASAAAQQVPGLGRGIEIRPFAGALVPTGDQRDLLEDAVLTGVQLGYRFGPRLSVVGTAAWSPSTDRSTWGPTNSPYRDQDVDLFQYDLGLEGRLPGAFGTPSVAVTPFASIGAGGRTYDYRHVESVDAETHVVGFVGLGTEIGPRSGWWAVRLEARDYVGAFKGLRGELTDREARNDVVLAAGLTLNLGGR